MMPVLNVWYQDSLVGTLEDRQGMVRFKYAAEWLDASSSFPISLSLPLQPDPFPKALSTSFFDNFLPEEQSRKTVADNLGVNPNNVFALLNKLGAECAGALSIIPENTLTPSVGLGSYEEIPEQDLPGFIERLPTSPLGTTLERTRLSLAGAQDKISLLYREGRYYIPLDGAPGNYLLKGSSGRFPDLIENEAFCMILATGAGLNTSPVKITQTVPSALLVHRYDREQKDGQIIRIHQEDFCQALGMSRDLKYQGRRGNGVTTKMCVRILEMCENSLRAKHDFLRWCVFNFLIGNADAHGKNISVFYPHGHRQPVLAPFYDLVCTEVYEGLDSTLAMKIGSSADPKMIGQSDWKELSKVAGIAWDEMLQLHILSTCDVLLTVLNTTAFQFGRLYGSNPTIPKIRNVVLERIEALLYRVGKLDQYYSDKIEMVKSYQTPYHGSEV